MLVELMDVQYTMLLLLVFGTPLLESSSST